METIGDVLIWCDVCCEHYVDACPACGPLTVIPDTPVPQGAPDRARRSLPEALRIEPSAIHGLGVFARCDIAAGVRFGPYGGVRVPVDQYDNLCVCGNLDPCLCFSYDFGIEIGGRVAFVIKAGDESTSNWMRFVNCARYGEEQNVQAYQYLGEVYFRTTREIEEGQEVLVWYGDKYAQQLGLIHANGTCRRPSGKTQKPDECRNVVKLQRVKRLLCTQKRVTARLRVALRKSESEEQRLRAKLQRLRGKEPQTGSDQA